MHMKTINPHTLLETPKTMEVTPQITELFITWQNLMKEKTDSEINNFDSFIAGYFLANNFMLKEKYQKYKKQNDKIL